MGDKKITKDMNFQQVLMKYPETAQVFLEKGMHCIGCVAATFENIEQGAIAHGIDVAELINALNNAVEKKSNK